MAATSLPFTFSHTPLSHLHGAYCCVIITIIITAMLPAHDELGTCRTSLVFPKQSVLRISIGSADLTAMTITQSNIMETRPRATRWTKPLDFTKTKACQACDSTYSCFGTKAHGALSQYRDHLTCLSNPDLIIWSCWDTSSPADAAKQTYAGMARRCCCMHGSQ